MKHSHLISKMSGAALAAFVASFLATSLARAQNNYYFDPGSTGTGTDGTTASGGSGVWDTENTADWYAPTVSTASDVVFPSLTDGPGEAFFDGVGGNVDVDGVVQPASYLIPNVGVIPAITFGGSGTYILSPDATDGGSITLTPLSGVGYYATNLIAVNSGNVEIDTPMSIDASADSPGQVGFTNYGTGDLTLNSTINLNNGAFFILTSNGGGSIVDNATFTGTDPGLVISSGLAEFGVGANANGAQLDAGSGTFLIDTTATAGNYSGLIGQSGLVLLNGAVTIASGTNQFTRYGGGFGGATADDSTFAGSIQNYAGVENLVAAAGGKVNFNGEVNQFGGVGAGNDLVIGATGTGVVSLNNATGQTFGQRTSGSNSDVGTEIAGGTALFMNTSGSATGNGALGTVNNTVQLDAGAALGGTGYTQQNVVAMAPATMGGAEAIITPGDMTKGGVSSIGTLHLDNGLAALSGLTGNFQLAGAVTNPYDQVEISTQTVGAPLIALDLAGPITFNLSGTVDTADTYTLFYSTAGTLWNVATGVYSFTGVPVGYTAVESYVPDDLSNGEEELNVSFVPTAAIPEPSTWALMGLGALVLIGSGKFRKLRA